MAAHPSTILVATDGSDTAAAALACAVELARDLDDRLLVLSAWHELRGDFGVPLHTIFPALIDVEREWATKVATKAAEAARAAGVEAEPLVRHGQAAAVIHAVACEHEPRLVVVGSHGWGKVQGLLFGSVSSAVLHEAPCPVVIVPRPHAMSSDANDADS